VNLTENFPSSIHSLKECRKEGKVNERRKEKGFVLIDRPVEIHRPIVYGSLWLPIAQIGSIWPPLAPYDFLWLPMAPNAPYGSIWVHRSSYGSPWLPMVPYGSL
jgi:hypothetical protein